MSPPEPAGTTRAVLAPDFGGPEVLELIAVPIAAPGPGEVVLDVRAAGVNPVDWKRYAGHYGGPPDRSQLPMRIGLEASGVVTAVGEGAVGPAGPIAAGDEVIAFRIAGAYAERVVIAASAARAEAREHQLRAGRRADAGGRDSRPLARGDPRRQR
jgi:NADPH:quinone reductase